LKPSRKSLLRALVRLRSALRRRPGAAPPGADEQPLRAELYSAEQMEQHGRVLAGQHRLGDRRLRDPLLTRLAENEAVLLASARLLTGAIADERAITPAGEWLLDNLYLIEEQIRTARQHLPRGYAWELPRLGNGPSTGLPRVYDIALETISHGDGRVDRESLQRFIEAYQLVTPLALGELWAIPIMLRLALIENLRRVGARIAQDRMDRNLANAWADDMIATAERDPKNLILEIADMARSNPPITGSFVAELARRLQGQSPALALPLTWIEQHLSEAGLTIEQLVQSENQHQTADQVSIANSIGSLRFLAVMDWRDFVEAVSVAERILRRDPAGAYARMDFATRDRYRHALERIARRGDCSEPELAHEALALAQAASGSEDERLSHVGWYLVGPGLPALERVAESPPTALDQLRRRITREPLALYLGAMALVTVGIAGLLVARTLADGSPPVVAVLVSLAALVVSSQFAHVLVNWLATIVVEPAPLPRLDFAKGIPRGHRTLVVVPTLLTSAAAVDRLLESLEVRYLANRDEHLHLGLLTDLPDAAAQALPGDAALVERAAQGIEALNRRHERADGDRVFCLFHRPRAWNPGEGCWMGTERKRGKLGELNALLRGRGAERFERVLGDLARLREVRYVITLDTDTELPRDAARELVATLAHPLNRARHDAALGRVTAGYGILQPRVAASLPGSNRSRYARMHGGDAGIDPYTRAVSDVYQDLFGEGSFIGKGIYEVDAFERTLADRLPDNRILSHDLLEGCYARSGLVSDVQLYEDYPASYHADMARRHRWIRGDWQIASWLLPRAPGAGRTPEDARGAPNRLSWLSRWKILDNLRRSLVSPAMVALLVLSWFALAAPAIWLAAIGAQMLAPVLAGALLGLVRRPDDVLWRQHLAELGKGAARGAGEVLFQLACLPYDAHLSLDAIVRTSLRVLLTRRRLLEWTASSELERHIGDRLASWYHAMWIAPAGAIGIAALLLALRPQVLPVALPVLVAWCLAPGFAWWLSRPLQPPTARVSAAQLRFLRGVARRTWHYFERHVGSADHWLPPDNFQEVPAPVLAHRTSPTNIGLTLLSNLAAHDFGYLPQSELVERSARTLASMQRLARFRGHFYNWYDTRTLEPLLPLYVSTVDSGNLVGALLTLRPGLDALATQPVLPARLFDGLLDTVTVWSEMAGSDTRARTRACLARVQLAIDAPPATATQLRAALLGIHECLVEAGAVPAAATDDARTWAEQALALARALLSELDTFVPWGELPAPPGVESPTALHAMPSLRDLAGLDLGLLRDLDRRADASTDAAERTWLRALLPRLADARSQALARLAAISELMEQVRGFSEPEYGFLYDEGRHLFAIGYNESEHRRDPGYYDLLASEARLSLFVAIAQGAIPQESWFTLGRSLTRLGGEPVLLSWSGSMFEYLMPMLVMPSYERTLLEQSCRAAVRRQVDYGAQRDVPWGISESGYNAVDAASNYQYRAFGVPGLGLKRGLASDLVVAPYATALAYMLEPVVACENLERLATLGALGDCGYYEAIDYTASRQRPGQAHTLVRSYMVHHQGMSLLAFAHGLLGQPMQHRFRADPLLQAALLLLHERVPKARARYSEVPALVDLRVAGEAPEMPVRVFNRPDTPTPAVQLLSNGRYHVMLTQAGGGYSRWKDLAVTRWREDTTSDPWGTYCYLREVGGGTAWSVAFQPTGRVADRYEAVFSEPHVEFRRRDDDIETHTEIVVSPEDDIELRRIRVTNRSRLRRTFDLTSYAEVVLAPGIADALHPAFSNLFVQSEIVPERQAILCTRRPRSRGERPPWLFHLLTVHGPAARPASFETDRARFLGRGNDPSDPIAMRGSAPLSGTEGAVLDPIVSIRQRIDLDPDQTATVDLVLGVGETREGALALVEKYQDRRLADRVFEMAWTHSQVVLRQINLSEADAQLYGRMAGAILHAHASLRAEPGVIANNRRGQSGLWGHAISGDLPIVLLQIRDVAHIELVRQMVQAHAYWRLKGLAVDLVIWNEDRGGYRQVLHDQIMGLVAAGVEANVVDRPGGIFVRPAEQISDEDRTLVQAVARVIVRDSQGTLAEQIRRRPVAEPAIPRLVPTLDRAPAPPLPAPDGGEGLAHRNGLGGFDAGGREYVIVTTDQQRTPAPWVNVLANPHFGCVVSESGGSYTWCENAHQFRLTPWHNDPVSDGSGEALYLRDEETGHRWTATPLPRRGDGAYTCRHGFGYSVFEHAEDGIASELTVFVAIDAPVKFWALQVRNTSERARRLSATGYVEWVLGDLRAKSAPHVVTELDPNSGAILARNGFNPEFAERVAFFDVDDATRSISGDRAEFLGRNGRPRDPAALARARLSGRVGAGLDPCAAIQVPFELAPGQSRRIVFRLGLGRGVADASALVRRFRVPGTAGTALEAVKRHWQRVLGAVQVRTPDAALDVLANGWLVYQTLACRIWGRSGAYQSGGAFGFRDQLQDAMALVHTQPAALRAQLLLCASRQFLQGDVQHWWHPPAGRGVRTHCSDDFLWLPLAICRYVACTGDAAVLDESAPYLDGRPVGLEDDAYYDLPLDPNTHASLYQHGKDALLHGLRYGAHGLPLMGGGDWNDGMNAVGAQGRGESVWLGFFLFHVLTRFAPLARARGDAGFGEQCESEAATLRGNLERHAWDGGWYRRAYFDDGTPLGSAANDECQIDSIAQSWSVLSGAGDPARARMAMDALDRRLVRRDAALVQLLDPPFDRSALDPGYIRGYVPGVRENGGQYTHAAIWATMAMAALGDAARAWELFDLINPVRHGDTPERIGVYKVEPYVVAADVYAVPPHTGRGGWTWYTGSAGWMYRLILESLLGVTREGERLRIAPCLPAHWPGYTLHYRFGETVYRVEVRRDDDANARCRLDGEDLPDGSFELRDDGIGHQVEIVIASAPPAP